jgi:hypothetical protein
VNALGHQPRFDMPGLTLDEVRAFILKGAKMGGYSRTVIYSAVRGNLLWCVEEVVHGNVSDRKLSVYTFEKRTSVWSFAAQYEGRITSLTCPVSFLDEAPTKDPRWRHLVHQMQETFSLRSL